MGAPATGQAVQPMNLQQSIAQGLQAAGQTTAGGLGYQAPQLATTSLQPYMSPYEEQVVGQTLSDLERARQMQQNVLGAQAQQAGAFGGSRQAIAEAELGRTFAEQAARTAGQLRQAGFGQAQAAAQQDIATQMAAQARQQQAAAQLAGLAGQGYGIYTDIGQRMAQQGAQERAMQQQLLDLARQQYAGFMGAPSQAAGMLYSYLPRTGEGTTTQMYQPSTLQYLTSAANIGLAAMNPAQAALSGLAQQTANTSPYMQQMGMRSLGAAMSGSSINPFGLFGG
jgi:hypothetical protein